MSLTIMQLCVLFWCMVAGSLRTNRVGLSNTVADGAIETHLYFVERRRGVYQLDNCHLWRHIVWPRQTLCNAFQHI